MGLGVGLGGLRGRISEMRIYCRNGIPVHVDIATRLQTAFTEATCPQEMGGLHELSGAFPMDSRRDGGC